MRATKQYVASSKGSHVGFEKLHKCRFLDPGHLDSVSHALGGSAQIVGHLLDVERQGIHMGFCSFDDMVPDLSRNHQDLRRETAGRLPYSETAL